MKRFLASFAAICTICITSCSNNDPTANPTFDPITPITPSEDEAMSPTMQKEYLEKVANEFINEMPASDFQNVAELGKYAIENYDWNDIDKWAKDIFEASTEALGTTTTETKTIKDKWGTYVYNYIYTNYKNIFLASNFTGHFTVQDNKWHLTKSNDLQFIFNDKSGKQCIIKLETSGDIKKVHAFNIDVWQGWSEREQDYNESYFTCNIYYNRTQCTIGIPEKIIVTLTQGGSQVAKTTINANLSDITNEEFDISKSDINLSVTTELNNGYKFDFSQLAYSGNKSVSAKFIMSKNGKSLVTAAISSDISGIPSCNVSAFSSYFFNIDDYNTNDANAQNAFVKLDILGRLQFQGKVTDVRKFINYTEDAENNKSKESNFKSYINLANDLTDINLFYDGNAAKQATVKLESFTDVAWNGRIQWTAVPVLWFYDGSSYSIFEAFFNEANFKDTVVAFKTLANKYADLIDNHIKW